MRGKAGLELANGLVYQSREVGLDKGWFWGVPNANGPGFFLPVGRAASSVELYEPWMIRGRRFPL